MTREKANERMLLAFNQRSSSLAFGTLHQIYDHFEQQNKALIDMIEMLTEKIKRLEEPKTCDGCKSQYDMDDDCFRCSRYHHDYYEPKETK